MADFDSEAARLGITGALRVGKVGSEAPTKMGAWADPWKSLGYISGDGITETLDESREEFTPWQKSSPIRTSVTSSVKKFQAVLWESNFETISLYYRKGIEDFEVDGDIVSFTEGDAPAQDIRAFGIDVVDGVYARRFTLPYAEVTDRGDIVYKSDTIIAYDVTITALVGPDGISVKREFKEGWKVPTAPDGGGA